MKSKLFLLVLLLTLVIPVSAQQYLKSVGLRLGHTTGISYQKFVARDQAVDLMVSGRNNGVQLNSFYKWHSPAQFDFNDNFVMYYGVGGHFGYERLVPYNLKFEQPFPEFNLPRRSYFTMGVDVIIGLEYRRLVAPIVFTFDIKPYINYIGFLELDGKFWDSAISVKYVFNQ